MIEGNPVLVIGGTRGTGLLIARRLIERDRPVRVLARDAVKARATFGAAAEVVAGDITRPETLRPAVQGAAHIVFTAGVHSGRAAPEELVRQTDYEGVRHTLEAARSAGFAGRFLYLNSLGVTVPSLTATLLNCLKRNTLVWRRRVEDDIRGSGLDYSIIRVGFLLNRPGGRRAVRVSQRALPLALRHRIARADVAQVFVTALEHPKASRTTFDIVWGQGPRREEVSTLLDGLHPDDPHATAT